MAYSVAVREHAYSLFLIGRNPAQIAEQLASGSGRQPSESVVRRWIKEGGWEARKEEVDRESTRRLESQQADRRVAESLRAHSLGDGLLKRLESEDAPPIKTFEGGLYAYKMIKEWALGLDDQNRQNIPADVLMFEFFEQMRQRIPALDRAFKENWGEVKKIVQELRALQSPPKEIEGKVLG